jgi:hypothetical protein
MRPQADLSWYTTKSRERGVTPRCPFTSLSRCPRFFVSASLSKHAGAAGLSVEEEKKYEMQWRASEFWSEPPETGTSVSGGAGAKALVRFCPEFVFGVFGVFAESLFPYADPEEKERTLKMFESPSGAVSPNWRFRWSNIEERHYTDCPYYSMLSVQVDHPPLRELEKEEDLVIAQPGAFGFSLNLKVMLTRICRWWLKKND